MQKIKTKDTRPPSWEHQAAGRKFVRARFAEGIGGGLAFGPGDGKTRPTIQLIQSMHKTQGVNLVCVCNILSGMLVWQDNWADWADTPAIFVDLRTHKSEGLRFAQRMAEEGHLVICIVTYGSIYRIGYKEQTHTTKKGESKRKYIAVDTTVDSIPWDMFIADEIHKIATPGSVVSKYFRGKIKARHLVGLTGSLVTKNPGKAWAPIKFLTGDTIFPGPYADFLNKYGVRHPHLPGVIIAWRNLEDFAKQIARCFYVPDEAAFVRPVARHIVRRLELGAKSRKAYDQLTKDNFTALENFEVEGRMEYRRLIEHGAVTWPEKIKTYVAPEVTPPIRKDILRDAERYIENAIKEQGGSIARSILLDMLTSHALVVNTVTINHVLSVMRKQQQITTGYIVPDAPEDDLDQVMTPIVLGHEKIEAVMEDLEKFWVDPPNKPQPVVIVVNTNYGQQLILDAIKKRFGYTAKALDGSVLKAEDRHSMIREAANQPVFVLKAQVGSESIDCSWADAFLFFEENANTVQYEQLLKRMLRGARTREGIYIHYSFAGTVDERIRQILEGDLDLAARVRVNWRQAVVDA